MGFSCYTDFGVPQYGDLGPPEPWYIKAIREQEELLSKLYGRVDNLECRLSDTLQQLDKLEGIIDEMDYGLRERGIRLRGNNDGQ